MEKRYIPLNEKIPTSHRGSGTRQEIDQKFDASFLLGFLNNLYKKRLADYYRLVPFILSQCNRL